MPAMSPRPQVHLEAEYTATLAGLPIGHGAWAIEIAEDQYTAAASGATSGLLRIFTGARGTSASRGSFNGDQTMPTSYIATIDYEHGKIDDVRMALAGGTVKDLFADPPLVPHPDRIPVSDADRRGVVDPMSSTINRVGGNGDPVSPLACARKVAVFDGRVRYNLRSEFKRIEMVKAERGYQGPVVVCAVYFEPISGYVPEPAGDQISRGAARRRGLDGADLRHPRAGAVPLLDADAARPGRVAGDPIRLGGASAPIPASARKPSSRDRRAGAIRVLHNLDEVTPATHVGVMSVGVPVIHRRQSLDSPWNRDLPPVLTFWAPKRRIGIARYTRSGVQRPLWLHISR